MYALGATIYMALTGDRPPSAVSRHFADEYKPLATRLAGSPYRAEMLAAVDRALSVHPKDRPQSAMEFRRALAIPDAVTAGAQMAQAGAPTETVRAEAPQAPARPVTFSTLPSAPMSEAKPRSRAGMLAASVLAIAMAGGGGWWMMVERPRQQAMVEAATISKAAEDQAKAKAAAEQREAEQKAAAEKERQRVAAAQLADAEAQAKRRAEEEAQRKAQDEARAKAAAEVERKAQEEIQRKAAAEAEQKRIAAARQLEEETKRKVAEAQRQAEAEKERQRAAAEAPPKLIRPDPLDGGQPPKPSGRPINPTAQPPAEMSEPKARVVRRFTVPEFYLTEFAFSPDGKTGVSGGCHKKDNCEPSMRLWDMATGRQIGTFSDAFTSVRSLAFSRDGRYVLAGNAGDGTLAIWDARTRKYIGSTPEYGTWQSGAISPDGKRAAGVNYQGKVRIFSAPQLKFEREMPAPGNVFAVAFSPDSKFVLSGESTINKWEVATGKLIWSVKPTAIGTSQTNIYTPSAFIFTANGAAVLAGFSSSHVQLLSAADGSPIWTIVTNDLRGLSISPDERHFATGGRGACYYDSTKAEKTLATLICPKHGSAKLWDMATRQPLTEITDIQGEGHPYFSPDGKSLLIIGYDLSNPATDRTMVLWDVSDFVK
ncbi:MAG: PD40 domain-containing protein [Proteobacteria bacterium]|nr:PD40 domain-containing protein [Pseudomonadota bacterium]